MKKQLFTFLTILTILSFNVFALNNAPSNSPGNTPSPPNAQLYFISPTDGQLVPEEFTVQFGLKNMGVAPAGIAFPETGHHHLLIDTDLPKMNAAIISDEQHVHFGKGQTETTIELSPGEHTLQLLLGDQYHFPHQPPVHSEKIKITVNKQIANK